MTALMVMTGDSWRPATRFEVQEAYAAYVAGDLLGGEYVTTPMAARSALKRMLGDRDHESFVMVALDTRHRIIAIRDLFRGTIDGASVHPREVVKEALAVNAAAVIFAHNHPSGVAEPSLSDESITTRLRDALALVDIRTLDHLIVTRDACVSLAEKGVL